MKQEIVPNEQNEVIPRRDIRAVEAIARSGRKLRPLTKPGMIDVFFKVSNKCIYS